MNKFVKGQIVEVIQPKDTYVSYEDAVPKKFKDSWVSGSVPNLNDVGIILEYISTELVRKIYAVQIGAQVYLINEGGLSEHRKEYRPKSITFREIREKYVELFSDEYFGIVLFGCYTEINYGEQCFQCPSEEDLYAILDALTTLSKFKVKS